MSKLKEMPRPELPCEDCMTNNVAVTPQSGGNLISVYCPHNNSGASLLRDSYGAGMWTLHTPIREDDFKNIAANQAQQYLSLIEMEARSKPFNPIH